MCRGDVLKNDCSTCVNKAMKDIQVHCPYNKAAIIWYDKCLLKYSDHLFFGEMDNQNTYIMLNRQNVKKDPAIFDKKVAMLLAQLASKVPQTATLYESGNINLDKSKKIYWLAQCALYLSNKDCEKCIEYSISTLQRVSHAKQGARIFIGGSCNIRYET